MAIYDVSTSEKKANPALVAGGTLYADSPIGTILPYGGASAPSGWFLCQGQAVSRTTYSELFAVIGTSFGVGDGSTTFNLPDMRESVPKGAGLTGKTVGAHLDADGLAVGEFLDDRLQNHQHSIPIVEASGSISTSGVVNQNASSGDSTTVTLIGRKGATTEVKSVGVNYIIKAKMIGVPADFLAKVDEAVEEVANSFIIDVMDCNTAFEDNKCIIYRTKSQATNKPDTDVNKVFFIHSDCFTDGTNYRITQIAGTNYSVSANEAYMYIRRGLSNTGKSNITWTAWQKLVTESEMNTYAKPHIYELGGAQYPTLQTFFDELMTRLKSDAVGNDYGINFMGTWTGKTFFEGSFYTVDGRSSYIKVTFQNPQDSKSLYTGYTGYSDTYVTYTGVA